MSHLFNYDDARQLTHCIYCGDDIETREHVPSRVFLDEPYPENLPVVGACGKCNRGYSLDEEYVACLIECARMGSVDPDFLEREKIRRILVRKPKLLGRIQKAFVNVGESPLFTVESKRFEYVLLKLALGHALFEQNEPVQEPPVSFSFGTLDNLSNETRKRFESIPLSKIPQRSVVVQCREC